jgi:hypothetical protein
MTDGQLLAIEQLRDIEQFARGGFEVVNVTECVGNLAGRVRVEVAIQTGHLRRAVGGLPLRDRERLVFLIPPGFPFDVPAVLTIHQRFAGFAHVQWTRQLCLYQAPNTEWDASDGMFGFIDRLEDWLRLGALGQLDPTGAPLHPPVAYSTSGRLVVPRANTPEVGEASWHGLAHLNVVSDRRVDVIGWSELFEEIGPVPAAAAILLAFPMPFEYPSTVAGLLTELEGRGVSRRLLLSTLQLAVLQNADDSPLYVLVGTPMRGIQGTAKRQQHLSAWYLDPIIAKGLRLTLRKYSESAALREIGTEVEQIIWDWAATANVSWCTVREQREEIVVRRDHAAPTAWFKDRCVALWGCGALGGHIAEFLTRAGVAKLILRDQGVVAPGLLVRQPFDDADIGASKVDALAQRLRRIRADVTIEIHTDNLVDDPLDAEQWTDGADLVIETTGSRAVLKKIELKWQRCKTRTVPIASMVVGPRAERGLVVLAGPDHSGGPADVVRKSKLAACADRQLADFRDDFWPVRGREGAALFQPEPGCSDPTFVGSAADVAVLAGAMLNYLVRDLSDVRCSAAAHFVAQPHLVIGSAPAPRLEWKAEQSIRDGCAGYDVRISDTAWESMLRQIEVSRGRRGARVETGGVLFGERDDAAGVIWVTDASGPPPDSQSSASGFVCGVVGTAEMNAEKRTQSYGAVQFLGMWHTHSRMAPDPSSVDLQGMAQIVTSFDPPASRALMIIVGHTPDNPTPAAYLFRRQDFRVVELHIRHTGRGRGLWARGRRLFLQLVHGRASAPRLQSSTAETVNPSALNGSIDA